MTWLLWTIGIAFGIVLAATIGVHIDIAIAGRKARRTQNALNRDGR